VRARDQSPPIDDGQHDPRAQSDRCPCGAPGAGRPNRRAGSRAGIAPAGRRCRRRCRRRRLDSRRALPRRSRSRAPATRSRRPAQSRPRRGPERPTWLAIRSPLRSSTNPRQQRHSAGESEAGDSDRPRCVRAGAHHHPPRALRGPNAELAAEALRQLARELGHHRGCWPLAPSPGKRRGAKGRGVGCSLSHVWSPTAAVRKTPRGRDSASRSKDKRGKGSGECLMT
jgi:hypothetical protein